MTRETDLKGPNSLVLWVLVGFGQLEALRGDLGAIEDTGWGIYSSGSFPARLMGFWWLRFSIKSHSSCWMELEFWPGSGNQSLLLPIQDCECKGPPMVASLGVLLSLVCFLNYVALGKLPLYPTLLHPSSEGDICFLLGS